MQDYPPLAGRGRRARGKHGYDRNGRHDTGASLWVATATVIAALAALLLFSHDNLRNGGGPFVITPPGPAGTAPNGGL